ncbi:MAG TPA: thioesterase [Alphaproteobacteria bacterium]|nr:thioesterase [Alphaproteobacteria bacterium]HBC54176.1 thioesterase [Alphaproteobacteria bacterium]HBF97768.1 thioesterase [Alphaproteobacteria bacterium]HCO91278.1 thioesterase [Alphaproteobacteria bacterium]
MRLGAKALGNDVFHAHHKPMSIVKNTGDSGIASEIALDRRATYRHLHRDIIRFADLDPNHHLNNVKFFEFCQESRVAMFREIGAHDGQDGRAWMIVNLSIDFKNQVHWPAEMETGTVVLRLGNSSARLGQGLFNEGRCVATADMTMVRVDQQTNRPVPIEDALRQKLGAYAGPAGQAIQ